MKLTSPLLIGIIIGTSLIGCGEKTEPATNAQAETKTEAKAQIANPASEYCASLGGISEAIRITGLVTIAMMCLGTLFPAFFQKISGVLTIALLLVIVVELIEIFIFNTHHGILDWIVVLIFCGYIGYDWGRANQIPKTVDNAVDSAAALYMDIINLFLRILRILGRK